MGNAFSSSGDLVAGLLGTGGLKLLARSRDTFRVPLLARETDLIHEASS